MSDRLADLVEQWRDQAWEAQRAGRPEIRDQLHACADELEQALREGNEA